MTEPNELPIACSLTPETIRTRKAGLLPGLATRAAARETIRDGMLLRFDPAPDILQAIATTIEAERQCCRFLRFELTVEPDGGAMSLALTGPPGTDAFLDALINA